MAKTMKLEIVTPEAVVYSEEVESVVLPSADGEITVLPDHIGLMTKMLPGEMVVQRGGRQEYVAVGQGIVEVSAKRIAILTDMAVASDKIDEAKVEEARQRAEARLREKISDEEVASVNAALARSLAQLKVKRHRHK